ncbi:fructose-bisphosphate aldolase class-I-domain-containing protein [Dunaliella salina]|uniref:fructose-bisphosphate aldolase n=1 Tax=Dunaliella salina TaxID=3046 RepID=A0ABQ7G7N9_DUNSA|nr:fructose-bisphosphate aldolase class-I-domain-containing protein [Dunaliella salina]|eukprot:KAF5830624.1 fructose-bisphosphate aldolase class-I-domain-containing protein [Dunaliella salina]
MKKFLILASIAVCLFSLFHSLSPGSPRDKMSVQLSESLKSELQAVAARLATPSKGLLAADESTSTIGKRFEKAGLKNEEEERRAYRELFMTSPGMGQSISGVIMFKETLYQKTADGKPFVECLREQGVEPGIKVDEGLQALESGLEGETWTKGLENLAAAAKEYKAAGATFAKWRAVLRIQPGGPSDAAVLRNAQELAKYAAICQEAGLVPVVEPEVLIDGDHDIVRFREVTERVVAEVVHQMWHKGVFLEGSLLKPQMVIPGTSCPSGKASPQDIAYHTVTAMRRVVPAAMPGIMFLSGGQTEEEATINLNAINLAVRACQPNVQEKKRAGRGSVQQLSKTWFPLRFIVPDWLLHQSGSR